MPNWAASYIYDKLITVLAIPKDGGWECKVTVESGGRHTDHDVTVSAAALSRWARGSSRSDVEDLVRRSFEFLLKREPPASILRRFDLSVIESYFPEYDEIFRKDPG
jgi:hypothetical protein